MSNTAKELRTSEEILAKLRAQPDTPAFVIDVVKRDVDRLRKQLAEEGKR